MLSLAIRLKRYVLLGWVLQEKNPQASMDKNENEEESAMKSRNASLSAL